MVFPLLWYALPRSVIYHENEEAAESFAADGKMRGAADRQPEGFRGKWLERFPGYGELRLELGCGKGRFTADTAENEPGVLFIALEKVPDAMIIAMERIKEREIKNVRFIDGDAAGLLQIFAPEELSRIYINFCDPWPKSRDAKFRLTAPGFLRLYADGLKNGGQIHFKTDNAPLFDWSLEQFEKEGWAVSGADAGSARLWANGHNDRL